MTADNADLTGGGRFGIVPADVLDDTRLSRNARWLWSVCCAQARKADNQFRMNLSRKAREEGVTKRALQNWMNELVKAGFIIRYAREGKASIYEVVRDPKKRPCSDGGENQGLREERREIHGSKGAGANPCSSHKQEEKKVLNKTDGPSVGFEALAGSNDTTAQHAIRPVQGAVCQGHLPRPPSDLPRRPGYPCQIDWVSWAKWLSQTTGSSLEETWNWTMEQQDAIAKELIVPKEEADRLLDGCLKRSRKAGIPPAAAIEELLNRGDVGRCHGKPAGWAA